MKGAAVVMLVAVVGAVLPELDPELDSKRLGPEEGGCTDETLGRFLRVVQHEAHASKNE